MTDQHDEIEGDADQESGGWLAYGLLLLVIVAPIAWFGFHAASVMRVAIGVGALCVVVGTVKGRAADRGN